MTPHTGKGRGSACSRHPGGRRRRTRAVHRPRPAQNPPVEDGLPLMADRLLDAGLQRGRGADDGGRRTRGGWRDSRFDERRLLVVGAHAADFVWRAGGAIAMTTRGGGTASVLALSYGERGESGELWKEPGQTVESVKQIRHAEAQRAAARRSARLHLPRPRRLPARARHGRARAPRRRHPRVRSRHAHHAHRHRSLQPRPSGRLRGDRAGPRAGGRRGRGERVQDDHAAAVPTSSSPTSRSCATSPRRSSPTSPP